MAFILVFGFGQNLLGGFAVFGDGFSVSNRPLLGPLRKNSVSKTIDQNWADALAVGDKGSCFKREKRLTLDEEDV